MRGRKSIKRDEEEAKKIAAMRQFGLSIEQVCVLTGLSRATVYKLYAHELEEGVAAANLLVGKKLFERCQAGDVTALIFWAKTRMGWREKDKSEDKNPAADTGKQMADAVREAFRSVGE